MATASLPLHCTRGSKTSFDFLTQCFQKGHIASTNIKTLGITWPAVFWEVGWLLEVSVLLKMGWKHPHQKSFLLLAKNLVETPSFFNFLLDQQTLYLKKHEHLYSLPSFSTDTPNKTSSTCLCRRHLETIMDNA